MVAVALLAVGTLDDRIGLNIGVRVLAEGAAAVLFYSGLGWALFGSEVANLLLTILFVLAVVNAFNLMDNLDGATTTIALISAVRDRGLCGGPRPRPRRDARGRARRSVRRLSSTTSLRPGARIFLGDGGSMAIGMTLAGLREPAGDRGLRLELLPVIVVLVGLPALDTALVIVCGGGAAPRS